MTEGREIEIRSQFPIGAGQNAKIELRRDPFPVIVGKLQNPARFFAINPDQQASAAPAKKGDVAEERDGCDRVKVTDGGSGKERHGPPGVSFRVGEF